MLFIPTFRQFEYGNDNRFTHRSYVGLPPARFETAAIFEPSEIAPSLHYRILCADAGTSALYCINAGSGKTQDDKLLLHLLHSVHPVLQQLPPMDDDYPIHWWCRADIFNQACYLAIFLIRYPISPPAAAESTDCAHLFASGDESAESSV